MGSKFLSPGAAGGLGETVGSLEFTIGEMGTSAVRAIVLGVPSFFAEAGGNDKKGITKAKGAHRAVFLEVSFTPWLAGDGCNPGGALLEMNQLASA